MKGILFKTDMLKAIVDGRKTVTRRLGGLEILNRKIDFANQPNSPDEYSLLGFDGKVADFSRYAGSQGGMSIGIIYHLKPRYFVGDIVYIKEAHHFHQTTTEMIDGVKHPIVFYKARDTILSTSKWRNPRTMPAWAARYFLQITGVRAERLQEITEEDAKAEGCVETRERIGNGIHWESARGNYCLLWESINKEHQWADNPFVWRYEFKLVPKPDNLGG